LIEEKNEKRESELIERYKSVYPHIVFPPKNENFDLIVDTKDIFPDDIVDIIFKHLES
jgi:cytidylate kinase